MQTREVLSLASAGCTQEQMPNSDANLPYCNENFLLNTQGLPCQAEAAVVQKHTCTPSIVVFL
ncbi:hypothetical protein COEREDRAFT_80181 [Coemansia reversa NRRL 1564]|uniref:Uncharacterized protein n=1 Tax=Coemansia reversa (strain ATCC 12441 / NRRL 1564) TaxID=763665 RepID=A0A2G5BFP6_COERN|nr:hypothetical protein COEREDRAFT_80181 [Coemansia reversa NRRL 1564]|eukprot:PIA17839.1 hypothetical protein COEREDRAFT_80181 [Coemansia reversa NRRL 1564]